MSHPRLRLSQLLRLSFNDLWHERWLAFCAACVLAATMAPIGTLWGLELGVIGALVERQDHDPLMRLLLPESSGSTRFDAAWFERVRQWPEASFVMPNTRALASQVDLYSEGANAPVRVDLLPTATRDPLLGTFAPPDGNTVLLSASAAQQISAKAGQVVQLSLERERNGRSEQAVVDLKIAAILPPEQVESRAALASLALLESVQSWRDGYVIDGFSAEGSGPAPKTETYPLFRLYARSIRDVEPLAARLEAEGVSTHTRVREIAATLGLQQNLRTVLALIGGIAVAGALVALSALQFSTLRRKRREYALLKLTGHGRAWLMALPCVNAVVVSLVGGMLALAFYGATATAINLHFAAHLSPNEAAVRLPPGNMGAGLLAAIIISVLPALWGGWRASRVEAADELRDN
ncbi:ABC transporter permease [Variovorax rhizosphaerae]|uniref:ABC transporter permease n=1 Tax=Variovorax rhizosphaerae TaxID=1836200 RepID=A0ABU8WSZ1_9BURK